MRIYFAGVPGGSQEERERERVILDLSFVEKIG
jgi:hypothetical protein